LISSLYETTYNILRDDATLESYCTSVFGSKAWIAVGYDEERSLNKDYNPLIQIIKISSVENEPKARENTFSIEVGVTLHQSETLIEPSITLATKKIEYKGVLAVEDFREQVENAIIRGEKTYKGTVRATGDTINNSTFPIYKSVSLLQLKQIKSMR